MSAIFRRLGISTATSAATSARAFSTSAARARANITIIGHLADAPESVTAASGREFVRYTVASGSGPKDNRTTSWFRVTSFVEGPFREFLVQVPKGSLVYVEGDASIDTYEGSDGKPRSALNVVQRHIDVLKRPATEATSQSAESESAAYHDQNRGSE